MKKKMHLKRHKGRSLFEKMLFSFFLAFLLALFFFFLAHYKLAPSITTYATLESKQFAKAVLNSVVRDTMKEKLVGKKLYTLSKNSKEEIETIDFNTTVTNELLAEITEKAMQNLLALENGDITQLKVNNGFKGANFKQYKSGVVCEIPFGLLTGHFFFANLGPVIPIRFSFVGMMDANLKSKITPYGINNALIEVYILVELTEKITMPVSSEEIRITLEVPLISQMISGKVPTYYQGGINGNSNILSIPLENNKEIS